MAEERFQRRLAAIVAADVVGYSRLVGDDEEGTIARFRTIRTELIDPTVACDHGRVVKTMGDGLLIEFPSAVDAVRNAVEIQRGMAERNAGLPENRRIEFRVGINLGDIVIDGDDILGDGVNVAARMEALADPGGICLSGVVHDQVEGRLDFAFEDLGEHTVKNIKKPIRVYRVRPDGIAATRVSSSGGAQVLALPDKPSIAVLPFANMSGDADQEYFADGITEDIITTLSKVRCLFVISRNSTLVFKGQAVDLRRVGEELGVRYVLEGSVRKAGNRVRINAQLVDTKAGSHIWAERYDREIAGIFDLQDEITMMIVGAIEPELAAAEREKARRKRPENLDAWDCYQRGLWNLYRFSEESHREARRLFWRAAGMDPEFAPALAGLAYLDALALIFHHSEKPAETTREAIELGERALALDDKEFLAHFALGRVMSWTGQPEVGIVRLEAALELNPSSAQTYHGLGMALIFAGRAAEGLTKINQAIRLSPRDPFLWGFMQGLSLAHLMLKECDEAANWARKTIQQPRFEFWAYAFLASALGHLGRIVEAQEALANAKRMNRDLSEGTLGNLMHFTLPDDFEYFISGLREAGLSE